MGFRRLLPGRLESAAEPYPQSWITLREPVEHRQQFQFCSAYRVCMVARRSAVEDRDSRRLRCVLRTSQRKPDDAGDQVEWSQSTTVYGAESRLLPCDTNWTTTGFVCSAG